MGLKEVFSKYRKVNPEIIKSKSRILPFDVFYFNTEKNEYVLLAKQNRDVSVLDKFKNIKFILKDDYNKYLALQSETIEVKEEAFIKTYDDNFASLEDKTKSLYNYADVMIEQSLNNPLDTEVMKKTGNFVKMVVDLASVNLSLVDHVNYIKDLNRYTFKHSINVFILTSTFLQLLAIKTNVIKPKDVLNASMGALYQDVGMVYIPPEIISKSEPLSDHDKQIIESHTTEGYKLLKQGVDQNQLIMDKNALEMVLYHHERIDGSGYPDKLIGDKIPFFARAGAICDVYDALNSEKPYRKSKNKFDAAKIMKDEIKGKFDTELLQKFIILLGPKNLIDSELEKRKLIT